MKYFIDFEFLEGNVPCQIKGFNLTKWLIKPNNTIQPISVGICSNDGREYYAVSKDFNLKEAWNRWDGEYHELSNFEKSHGFPPRKKYWIRENVLMPIFFELAEREFHNIHFKDEWIYEGKVVDLEVFKSNDKWVNNLTWFKKLIKKYGKTNKEIASEIITFTAPQPTTVDLLSNPPIVKHDDSKIEFYGYYSAYDHVALCWLFGKMINLPKGFPMYTRDLKQSFDEKQAEWISKTERQRTKIALKNKDFSVEIDLKKSSNYPKQDNEHNALNDAKWNKELYEFLKTIN